MSRFVPNALVRLDAIAGIALISLDTGALKDLEGLFTSYLCDAGLEPGAEERA
jgi:hypothetical protein